MIDQKFRVLMVCTANVCRSPMSQYLLHEAVASRWTPSSAWVVESAGVRAKPGLPIHPHAQRALNERDIDTSGFRSRRLSSDVIEQADLILTAERSHRASVTTMVPSAIQYTFTIRQFARLAALVPPLQQNGDEPTRHGYQLLSAALAQRSQLQPRPAKEDDLTDPLGGRVGKFRKCVDQLSQLVSIILAPTTQVGRS